MFRARLPSIFITSHKTPRLPRNLHLVATWRSLDKAIRKNTQHDTSKVLRVPRKMTLDVSKALSLPRKLQLILRKYRQSTAPATQNDFRHFTKHVWMSRSSTPATRNDEVATVETSKNDHRHGHTAPTRTVADGCERLRTVADSCGRLGNVERTHPEPPDPQSETGTLATHSGKNMPLRQCISIPRACLHRLSTFHLRLWGLSSATLTMEKAFREGQKTLTCASFCCNRLRKAQHKAHPWNEDQESLPERETSITYGLEVRQVPGMPEITSNKVWKKHLHRMRICTSPPSAKFLCSWEASDSSIDFLLLVSNFILSMLSNQGFLGLVREYTGITIGIYTRKKANKTARQRPQPWRVAQPAMVVCQPHLKSKNSMRVSNRVLQHDSPFTVNGSHPVFSILLQWKCIQWVTNKSQRRWFALSAYTTWKSPKKLLCVHLLNLQNIGQDE